MQDKFYRALVERALRGDIRESLGEVIDQTRRRLDARPFGPDGPDEPPEPSGEVGARFDGPAPDRAPGASFDDGAFRGEPPAGEGECSCGFRFSRIRAPDPPDNFTYPLLKDFERSRFSDGSSVEAFARTIGADGFTSAPAASASGYDDYQFIHVSSCPECAPVFYVVAKAYVYAKASAWPRICDEAKGEANVVCAARGAIDWTLEAAASVKEDVKTDLEIDLELEVKGQKVKVKYTPKVAESGFKEDSDAVVRRATIEGDEARTKGAALSIAAKATASCRHDDEGVSRARALSRTAVAVVGVCRCPRREPTGELATFGDPDSAQRLGRDLAGLHLPPVPLPPVSVAGGSSAPRTKDCDVTVSFLDATSTDVTRPTQSYRFDIRVDVAGVATPQRALVDGFFDAAGRFRLQGNPLLTSTRVPDRCDDRVPVSIGVVASRERPPGAPLTDGDRQPDLDGQPCTEAGTTEDVPLSFTRLGTERVDLKLRITRRCTQV